LTFVQKVDAASRKVTIVTNGWRKVTTWVTIVTKRWRSSQNATT